MDLTLEQQKNLLTVLEFLSNPDLFSLEKVVKLENKITETDTKVSDVVQRVDIIESDITDIKNQPTYILTESDKQDIASQIDVPVVEKVIEKTVITERTPIVTEKIVQVAIKDTPLELVEKLESLQGIDRLDITAINGLSEEIRASVNQSRVGWGAHPLTVKSSSATIDKNARILKFVGSTVTRSPDGTITITSTGGGSIALPISGAIDGSNRVFVFATAPTVLVVDNQNTMRKAPNKFEVNWTGTTTVTMTVAPTTDIYQLV